MLSFLTLSPQASSQDASSMLHTVVIDAGHGGRDPGARGKHSNEKDIVLDIALRLGKMIETEYPDVKVVYTRKKDVFVELLKRGDIANKANANLFISIHANSSKKKYPVGAETYVMGTSKTAANMAVAKLENSVIVLEADYTERYQGFDNSVESNIYASLTQIAYLDQSIGFASDVQEQFKSINRVDRGVQQANFVVLWKTAMPSVLVEVGFISNEEEEAYMNTKEGRKDLATSIFKAFGTYKTKLDARQAANNMTAALSPTSKPEAASKPEAVASTDEAKQTHNADTQQNEDSTAVKRPQTEAQQSTVEFAIQIGTSAKPMETASKNFKGIKGVERIQSSPTFYKYIVERKKQQADTQNSLKKIRTTFKDAFMVGIIDGKIVPIAEAIKAKKQ